MRQLFSILLFLFMIQSLSAQKPDTLADTSEVTLSVKVVCLLVNDYDEAIEFYTKKLGFVVASDVRYGEGQRWVSLKMPSDLSLELSLGLAKSKEDN